VDQYLFYALGAIAVGASLAVIGPRNPMHSVLWLIASFIGLSGLYVLLDAPFTAVTQIIIYAGAIMVLFLFVVMLLNAHREDDVPGATRGLTHGPLRLGAAIAVVLVAELGWALSRAARGGGSWLASGPGADPAALQSVRSLGNVLFTDYSLAFEVTSILIIVAMIGAVVLARREA
jgi:NADH-quinone oxidoreductase subunit J